MRGWPQIAAINTPTPATMMIRLVWLAHVDGSVWAVLVPAALPTTAVSVPMLQAGRQAPRPRPSGQQRGHEQLQRHDRVYCERHVAGGGARGPGGDAQAPS